MQPSDAMDVDPIDDGPRALTIAPPTTTTAVVKNITKDEDARQAIELLRSDEVAARVSAASRLTDIAKVLGPERTREVSIIELVGAIPFFF